MGVTARLTSLAVPSGLEETAHNGPELLGSLRVRTLNPVKGPWTLNTKVRPWLNTKVRPWGRKASCCPDLLWKQWGCFGSFGFPGQTPEDPDPPKWKPWDRG